MGGSVEAVTGSAVGRCRKSWVRRLEGLIGSERRGMMANVRVIKGFFGSKEEAIVDIKNEGFWPFAWLDKPGDSFEPHCHANDERLYLIEGALEFEDVSAQKAFHLEPGDKVILPARTVQRVPPSVRVIYIVNMQAVGQFTQL